MDFRNGSGSDSRTTSEPIEIVREFTYVVQGNVREVCVIYDTGSKLRRWRRKVLVILAVLECSVNKGTPADRIRCRIHVVRDPVKSADAHVDIPLRRCLIFWFQVQLQAL